MTRKSMRLSSRNPGSGPGASRIPEVVLHSRRGWVGVDWHELWAYRDLLYFFVWRDLKVRYKQTALGATWAVIQPLMLMVVFSLLLGRLSGVAPAGVPYPLFAFTGLVPWTLFASSLGGASGSLVEASNLLQKVYFPRVLLPAAAVGSYLADFAISMVVLAALMFWYGVPPTSRVVWVFPLTVLAIASALAVGIWLSAINVRYRDVRYAIPFILQVWMLASPVAYSANLVPPQWMWLFQLNPMAGVIEGFRWALLAGTMTPPPIEGVLSSTAVTAFLLVLGLAYFRRVERTFADVI